MRSKSILDFQNLIPKKNSQTGPSEKSKPEQTKEKQLELAKKYIESISNKPSGIIVNNKSNFDEQGLAIGLRQCVIKNISK